MNVFLLPLETTREIEKCLSKYWWSTSQAQNTNKSQLCWMSWDRMTKHKFAGGLGFRNFRDYNIAMLGKQGWRFLINPNSLVSRLYKARYFANTDFIHSTLGYNPSFIWRSIVKAKQMLLKGVRWRIGSGENIKILGQPWLMVEDNPYITSSSQAIENATVNSLFCMDRKEWDTELINDIFNTRDQECIARTPLQGSNEEDNIFWRLEDSGEYSVKSAYKFLQSQKGERHSDDAGGIWHDLWCIKAPPKCLNLVWRALSKCLPTLTQLNMKHVPVQAVCPVCNVEVETIMHCLVSCSFAKQCWSLLLPEFQWDEEDDFMAWFKSLLIIVGGKRRAEAVTLCWSIWRSRNDKVWNKKSTTINRVVASTRQYLTQWQTPQGRFFTVPLQPQVEGDGAVVWAKPSTNEVKISVDAAVFEDRGGVGFGLVSRGADGLLIEAKALFHPQVVSHVLAEAMAVKEALSWCDNVRGERIIVETDCLVVVQAIRSSTPMRSHFGSIIEDCRWLLKRLNKVSLFFVKRSANMIAHNLARESYAYSGRIFDRSSIPMQIQNCIEEDLRH